MANSWFQFQQFKVNQDQCAMKISTDAVLIGGLAATDSPKNILDVGTGTGVISLMLAQRFSEAEIIGVEIDEQAAIQAESNFKGSPFSERLKVWNGAFQSFECDQKFDIIVSNPPYFPNHLKAQDHKRNQALHTDSLSFHDFISKTSKLLRMDGNLWVILPSRQMLDLIQIGEDFGLFPIKKFIIQDKPGKKVLREIISFSFQKAELLQKQIIIKNEDGTFHLSYRDIVTGFLLGFK